MITPVGSRKDAAAWGIAGSGQTIVGGGAKGRWASGGLEGGDLRGTEACSGGDRLETVGRGEEVTIHPVAILVDNYWLVGRTHHTSPLRSRVVWLA